MTDLGITAFIMGTCHPQRLIWLKESLDYMDSQNFPFVKKVLAIDEFNGHTFPITLKEEFEKRGWTIIIDNHRSRVKSMDNAFSIIDSEYIFYNEEDVKATLPTIQNLNFMFKHYKVGTKECGMVSLTLGGSSNHFPANEYGDLKDIEKNVIVQNNDYLIFRREEEKRNNYFFEFPGLFVNTKLFKDCHRIAKKFYPNQQVEMGLTSAYFSAGYDTKFYKTSIAKNNIYEVINNNPSDFIAKCRLLENLDENQGNSPLGGSHTY